MKYSDDLLNAALSCIYEKSLTEEHMEEIAQEAIRIMEAYPEEEAVKRIQAISRKTDLPTEE